MGAQARVAALEAAARKVIETQDAWDAAEALPWSNAAWLARLEACDLWREAFGELRALLPAAGAAPGQRPEVPEEVRVLLGELAMLAAAQATCPGTSKCKADHAGDYLEREDRTLAAISRALATAREKALKEARTQHEATLAAIVRSLRGPKDDTEKADAAYSIATDALRALSPPPAQEGGR